MARRRYSTPDGIMNGKKLPSAAPADRWYVLAILTLVYALNIADRFSISTLIEPIRRELRLSDSGIGFLTGVSLALFYVTVGIPIAALADRANRRNILALALAIWSGMTALCGLAQSYTQLLLARFAVGIGEAGGTPPSTSILADKFPAARRPMALTIFALGACLGAWLGSSVAGTAAEHSGWRQLYGSPSRSHAAANLMKLRTTCLRAHWRRHCVMWSRNARRFTFFSVAPWPLCGAGD